MNAGNDRLGTNDAVGTRVVHRRYVPYSHAHYAGDLVDGAYGLGLFGDVATELCILLDGDEGLFASYSDVQFLAPVRAGDVVEVAAELVRQGTRSRELDFTLTVVARGAATIDQPGRAQVTAPPLLATTARGTVVVPPR
ncbi:MAG: hotdog domain-containing protein [Nocardioides sp.]